MKAFIYDDVKKFAAGFAAAHKKAMFGSMYEGSGLMLGEAAESAFWTKKENVATLKWAQAKALQENKPVYVHIHHHDKEEVRRFEVNKEKKKFYHKSKPEADFDNIPIPNQAHIDSGTNSFELESSQLAFVETQFADNLKAAMTLGAVPFPTQDFNNTWSILFESPKVETLDEGNTYTDFPFTPMYDQGWFSNCIKVNVPATLLPGGADPNENWPLAYIRSCGIQWIKQPRMRFFVNNMVRFAPDMGIMRTQSHRMTWTNIVNYVPYWGGMDITAVSYRMYEWISPHYMPLQRLQPDDPNYEAQMETWYELCDKVKEKQQELKCFLKRLRAQDTASWENFSLGPLSPVDREATEDIYSDVSEYFVTDTDIPWKRVSHYGGDGFKKDQNDLGYGAQPINIIDKGLDVTYPAKWAWAKNPEIEMTLLRTEEIPANGLDFSRGGTFGVPSIFFPNAIAAKTELQTLFTKDTARAKETQAFYYYVMCLPCVPIACYCEYGLFEQAKYAATLPFHNQIDADAEMKFSVTGNYLQYNNAAWNRQYSNLYSPAMRTAVPTLNVDYAFHPYTQQLDTAEDPFVQQIRPHFFTEGQDPIESDPTTPALHPETGLHPDDFQHLRDKFKAHASLKDALHQSEECDGVPEEEDALLAKLVKDVASSAPGDLTGLKESSFARPQGPVCLDPALLELCKKMGIQYYQPGKVIPRRSAIGTVNNFHSVPQSLGGHKHFSIKSVNGKISKEIAEMLPHLTMRLDNAHQALDDIHVHLRIKDNKPNSSFLHYRRF